MANASDFREILFAIKDIRDGDVIEGDYRSGSSIFAKAKPAILNFPVICSDIISLEDLTMTAKALEREYATVVRLAMGLDDIIDGKNRTDSKIDYIRKFHTNDGVADRTLDSLFIRENAENLMDCGDSEIPEYKESDVVAESLGLNMGTLNDMTNKNNNNYVNLFSEAKIKQTTRRTTGGGTRTHEASYSTTNGTSSSSTANRSTTLQNGSRSGTSTSSMNGGSTTNTNTTGCGNGRNGGGNSNSYSNTTNNSRTNTSSNETNRSTSRMTGHSDQNTASINNTTGGRVTTVEREEEVVTTREMELNTLTAYNNYTQQLLDNDVKKANELIPTTMDITVYQKVGEETIVDHILLGVKCTAHKVSSNEMIENIYQTLETKKGLFRFIQWTTGEIKFFKDYLLCLDTLKKEALRSRAKDKSSYWFRSLKNKSTISKIRSAFNLKNQLIPNSTLVITMDEVDLIRNMYRIDLLNDIKTVDKLISIYFLIGFVILDPAQEVAYFKFDSFPKYQMHTFRSLERENRNQGNDIKALVSLMSKY